MAQKYLDDAIQFVQDRSMKNEIPQVVLAQAKLNASQGNMVQALENFEHAEALALELGMRPLVWRARAGASLCLTEMGQEKEAQGKQYQALEMINEIGDLFEDKALKTKYLEGKSEITYAAQ